MRPDVARAEYIAAFTEIATRIAKPLAPLPKRVLPISMYVAGGAALRFYTGERTSRDINASFSHRIVLPEDLEVSFRDADGASYAMSGSRPHSWPSTLMAIPTSP